MRRGWGSAVALRDLITSVGAPPLQTGLQGGPRYQSNLDTREGLGSKLQGSGPVRNQLLLFNSSHPHEALKPTAMDQQWLGDYEQAKDLVGARAQPAFPRSACMSLP